MPPEATAPDATAEITPDMLGIFTDDDINAPLAEPAVETPATPATPPAAEAAPPAPEKPAPAAASDEFLTLQEMDERFSKTLDAKLAPLVAKLATQTEDEDDEDAADIENAPPEIQKLHRDHKALLKEHEALKAQHAEMEDARAEQDELAVQKQLKHSIESTAGKLKMTPAEVEGTTRYLLTKGNEDLHAAVLDGNMTFEEAAMRRFPGIEGRAKAPPVVPAEGEGLAPPAATGPAAPTRAKFAASPRDYSDITRHTIKNGEAAALGRYT